MVDEKINNLTVSYFGTWVSYKIPFVPSEPILEEEAYQREVFYKAYYNTLKQLMRFEKYINMNLEWRDDYKYWDNGKLKKRNMTKSDNTIIIQNFNKKGKIILE